MNVLSNVDVIVSVLLDAEFAPGGSALSLSQLAPTFGKLFPFLHAYKTSLDDDISFDDATCIKTSRLPAVGGVVGDVGVSSLEEDEKGCRIKKTFVAAGIHSRDDNSFKNIKTRVGERQKKERQKRRKTTQPVRRTRSRP